MLNFVIQSFQMKDKAIKRAETICAQAIKEKKNTQPHQMSVCFSSAFRFDQLSDSIKAFENQPGTHVYSRYGNPTMESVAAKIAALEIAGSDISAHGLLTSSGMSAIYLAVTALLGRGDMIITQANLYGGTTELFNKVLQPQGIKLVFMDLSNLEKVEKALRQKPLHKIIYLETPSNPTLHCYDIKALAELASRYHAFLIVDNTFCTPIIQQPLLLGADIVLHSTTKFIHGHGASTGGVILVKEKTLFHQKIWQTMKLIGVNSNPMDAWMIQLGMMTLHLRMERHSENAFLLAKYLSSHPKVSHVNYPFLSYHPSFEIAKKQMSAGGAMLSFEAKTDVSGSKKMIDRLRLAAIAPSLGETGTMVLHPATSSHLKVDPELRKKEGINNGLIRVSVGLEHIDDIISDFDTALKKV